MPNLAQPSQIQPYLTNSSGVMFSTYDWTRMTSPLLTPGPSWGRGPSTIWIVSVNDIVKMPLKYLVWLQYVTLTSTWNWKVKHCFGTFSSMGPRIMERDVPPGAFTPVVNRKYPEKCKKYLWSDFNRWDRLWDGGCVVQRQLSCFPPSSPVFESRHSQDFFLFTA